MKFKGVDNKGILANWYDEWYWIDQEIEKNQRQFVYQDMCFYLPDKATKDQIDWVEHLLSKDTVDLQDLKNWFEFLEDSTQYKFNNIYLLDEIAQTKTNHPPPHRSGSRKTYIRKKAHIVLFNDNQTLSAPGMEIAKQLGNGILLQKLCYTWKNIPGPAGVTAKQITVANANTVWMLDNNGFPWQWKGGTSWSKKSGILISISVAPDATLWGTNAAHVVYRYNGTNDKWAANVPAGMKQVAAINASSAWDMDSNGTGIFYWSGSGSAEEVRSDGPGRGELGRRCLGREPAHGLCGPGRQVQHMGTQRLGSDLRVGWRGLSATAAGGLFVASMPQEAQAEDACVRKEFKTTLVKDACTKGGQAEAKKVMKKFLVVAKAKNPSVKDCKSCHTTLTPDYKLTADAIEQFMKAGGK